MSYPFLSVLTEPQPEMRKRIAAIKSSILRPLRYYVKGKILPNAKKYGGHNAVTRSLVEGLEKIGATFNYNETKEEKIYENVILLSGIEKLKEAFCLKKNGKIKLLLVGPNIVDHVLDYDNIVADPLVDYFVVPSEWVKKIVLADCPLLKNRILIWPSGIDSKYWAPKIPVETRKKVLVYKKTENKEFHDTVLNLLKGLGFDVEEIEYGNYNSAYFKKRLDKAGFAIFISRNESQGIALAEAWSMDVPTLVYNPGNFVYREKLVEGISACPFLTGAVGRDWKTIDELGALLQKMKQDKFSFTPRKFVLERFTDEICAKDLLDNIKRFRKSN